METKEENLRTMILVLPLLVLPFLALAFYGLGGGKGSAPEQTPLAGINTTLPDAQLRKDESQDKLSLYGLLEKDSSAFKDQFRNLSKDQEGDFLLAREAGRMNFHGKFDGNMGMGTYKFNPDKSFSANLSKEGIRLDNEDDALVFFLIDVKKSYIGMLKKQGFTEMTKDELIPLAALKVDESFIHAIKSSGFSDVSLQNLILLKALGVDQAYIANMKKSGYKNLSVDQLITLKAQGINGDFLKSSMEAEKQSHLNALQAGQFKQAERKGKVGIRKVKENKGAPEQEEQPSIENIIAMKVMNVDAAFRNSFKKIGFNISDENLIAMKSLGITRRDTVPVRVVL